MLIEKRLYCYEETYILNALHDTLDEIHAKVTYSNLEKKIYKFKLKRPFNSFLARVEKTKDGMILQFECRCFLKKNYYLKKKQIDEIFELFEKIAK